MNIEELIDQKLKQFLEEDIGSGDITSESIIPSNLRYKGEFISKADGVIAGLEIAAQVFRSLSPDILFNIHSEDGKFVKNGQTVATINGPARQILMAERVALNLLQRMSGIATITRQFVEKLKGTNTKILDTRKTAPGLRIFDKLAVKIGGGENHRFGLFDMVLIKENHITVAGSISEAVSRVQTKIDDDIKIEVEVKSLDELHEALQLKIDRILLDNMSIKEMKKAVQIAGGRIPLEASGNVTPDRVEDIAATGVNFISAGMLTHSVEAMDISLLLKSVE